MKSVNVLDIIRKILSVLTVLFLFLPWIVADSSAKAGGISASSSESEIGFKTIFAIIVPVVLVLTIFLGTRDEKWNVLFLYAPIAGVIITILIGIFYSPGSFEASSKVVSSSTHLYWGIGLWLSLIVYIAIFVITLIIRLKISKESLKEDGIKGIAVQSVNELKNSAFEIRDGVSDIGKMPGDASPASVKPDKISAASIMDKVPVDSIKGIKNKIPTRDKSVGNNVSNNVGPSSAAKQTYLNMKAKLDDAFNADIITEEEYKKKLQKAKIKYVKEDTIERIELQYELDIISAEDRDAKLAKLGK